MHEHHLEGDDGETKQQVDHQDHSHPGPAEPGGMRVANALRREGGHTRTDREPVG